MKSRLIKIGELADKTGLTVRTIRYYDEIGLLEPSERSRSGYRLYGREELERLQMICSLKSLGLQLDEIRESLEDQEYDLLEIIHRQMRQVRTEIEIGKELYRHLDTIANHLKSAEKPTAEQLLNTLKAMNTYEKYYTKEQLEYLEQRKQKLGEDRIREVQEEWKKLIDRVRKEKEKGTDPGSVVMQKLAARWEELIREFTGGNHGVRRSLADLYRNEDTEEISRGFLDEEIMGYMGKAMKKQDED